MKIRKNLILALSLALLVTLPPIATSLSMVSADEETGNDVQGWLVEPKIQGVWYKFETPLITLLFPAGGKKPMFIWWYTNDNSTVYVVKFKGVIEYLIPDFAKPYYRRRFYADGPIINATLWKNHIEPKMRQRFGYGTGQYVSIVQNFMELLLGLHGAFLPFDACEWNLAKPQLVEKEEFSYWSFNFTLAKVYGHPRFKFAEENIQIRCRFYVTNATETPDANYPDYNYTVAAGQLKFDFVVSNWKWNIDKIKPFLEELKDEYGIETPPHETGLALWINLASIRIKDLSSAEDDVQNQDESLVEARSQMQGAMIGDQYYPVNEDKIALGEDERPIQLTNQFREHVRIRFARKEATLAGFLEFVPWARKLNETGGTVEYVNVTASYIAAGAHMRLFLCYPYFGNYTLEHDPTIGLALAPPIPTLVTPNLLMVLIGATILIAVAVAAVKLRKKTVNLVSIH